MLDSVSCLHVDLFLKITDDGLTETNIGEQKMKQLNVSESYYGYLKEMLEWFDRVPSVPLPDYFWERTNDTMLDLLNDGLIDRSIDIGNFYTVELHDDGQTITMIARDVSDEEWAIVI